MKKKINKCKIYCQRCCCRVFDAIACGCNGQNKAKQIVLQNAKEICAVADGVLRSNGLAYKSTAQIKKENFPTRVYDEVVFEQGEYDALIVNLGSGSGDNWWCVVYPPLCFVGGEFVGEKVVYKSKLQEIVENFLG